jgi:rare lipoprotein A
MKVTALIPLVCLFFSGPAHAYGWDWFLHHMRPSGKCGGGREIVVSYYDSGRRTASGERFNPDGISAAHRTLPFGSSVTITNPENGRAVTVRINDRGPFIPGVRPDGAIDLSRGAARAIGMSHSFYGCMSL